MPRIKKKVVQQFYKYHYSYFTGRETEARLLTLLVLYFVASLAYNRSFLHSKNEVLCPAQWYVDLIPGHYYKAILLLSYSLSQNNFTALKKRLVSFLSQSLWVATAWFELENIFKLYNFAQLFIWDNKLCLSHCMKAWLWFFSHPYCSFCRRTEQDSLWRLPQGASEESEFLRSSSIVGRTYLL